MKRALLINAHAGHDLVDPVRGHRPPPPDPQPQLGPARQRVSRPDPQVPVHAPSRLVADLDDPFPAGLAADPDLPARQVQVAAGRIARVAADPGEFGPADAGRQEHIDDRGVPAGPRSSCPGRPPATRKVLRW